MTLFFCLSFEIPGLFSYFVHTIPQCFVCWWPGLLVFFKLQWFDLQSLIVYDFKLGLQKKGKKNAQRSLFFCFSFLHFQHLKSQFHSTSPTTPIWASSFQRLVRWFSVPFTASISYYFIFSTQSRLGDFQISMCTFLFNLTFPLFLFSSHSVYWSMKVLNLSFHAALVLGLQTHFYACYSSISTLPNPFLFSAFTKITSWNSLTFSISLFESFNEVDVLLIQNRPIVANVHFICSQILWSFCQALIRISLLPLEQLDGFLPPLLEFIREIL